MREKMFKFILIAVMMLEGVLLGANVEKIEVNGVEVPVIFEKDSTLPIASMQLIFQNSGSIADGNLSGIASFSASLLNEGTKALGAVGFAQKLEENAIHFSVHSGTETFVLELESLKEQFGKGVGLIQMLLNDPNFTRSAFDKVKLLKMSRIKQKENDFDYIASLNLKLLVYKDTPLGHPSIGTKESLDRLTLDAVRDYIHEHLSLERAIVVIGGDMDLKEAKTFAKEALGKLSSGKSEPLPFVKHLEKSAEIVTKKDTKQAYVYFSAPLHVKADDKERYKAKVAAFILGAGGFGSRMMEEIRVKRGLAYSAYCRANINKSHTSLKGYLQTKLESQDEAIKLVKKVVGDFVKEGITEEELAQAKKFIAGSEPLRNEVLSQRLNRTFMEYYQGLGIGYHQKELALIEKLTRKELNDFIQSHDEIKELSFSIVTK
jgi:predicted Zn-dependent peptidase